MSPADLLRRLPEAMRLQLPPALQGFQVRYRGWLCQWWYGDDPHVHYEVWVHGDRQRLELGLHFEADPACNEWLRSQFASRLIEVVAVLGRGVEAEPWDRGWTRLYETHPLQPVDEARLVEFAERAARFVATVQPLYTELMAEAPLWPAPAVPPPRHARTTLKR